jgi:hypothetical protein
MRRAAIAVFSLLAAVRPGPAVPVAEVASDGRLALRSLPAVLGQREVKLHLTTGLTTSFVLTVTAADASGHRTRGGGRIDVRYEPWDEVFHVQAAAGALRLRDALPSFDRLLAWWEGLRLPVAATAGLRAGEPWTVEVRLDVIPFSLAEQRDTQRWFTDSLDKGAAAAGTPGSPPSAAGAPQSHAVLDLLIATSIKRQSLVGYDWSIRLPPERQH